MAHLVSLREFARMQGWNPGYAHKLKMRGLLVMVDGKVDTAASLSMIAQSRDPQKDYMADVNARQREKFGKTPPREYHELPAGQSSNGTYNQARTASQVFDAKLKQVHYLEKVGALVAAQDIQDEQFNLARRIRDALLNLPDRVTPLIAAESDPVRIYKILSDEVMLVLNELTDEFTHAIRAGGTTQAHDGSAGDDKAGMG